MKKVLVITPVTHIKNVLDTLESINDTFLVVLPDCSVDELKTHSDAYAIFTNPNKSSIYLGKENLENFHNLRIICTASTGTVHIDKKYCQENFIEIISLTEERNVINKISSTAEHSFALMLSGLRNIPQSNISVKLGVWDYEPFIGRQINTLTIGVIGYGRLGTYFANYCDAFGARILVYDPYKSVNHPRIIQVNSLEDIASHSDVISLHVHVTSETLKMINRTFLSKCKSSCLLVNTSRGEIVDELDLIDFLSNNSKSKYCSDVLYEEIIEKDKNPILRFALSNESQVILTPHIGGMTIEAQEMAFGHAAILLKNKIEINLN